MNRIFLMLYFFMSLSTMSFSITLFSDEGGPVISGYITGFKDSTVIFLSNLGEQKVYDTTMIINNEFVLHGPFLAEPIVVFLEAHGGEIWTSMIIGNDKMKVEGDISDFPWNLRITGSKTEDENQKLKALTKNLDKRREEFVAQYAKALEDEKKMMIRDSMSLIDLRIQAIQVAFIKECPNTYIAALTLRGLRNQLSRDKVSLLFDLMNKEVKESQPGQIVRKFLETNVAKVGEVFTDFDAIDQKENAMKLSDVKGRYILLDFTASYCGPCRQSAEELREISKEYKSVLTLVSISADVSKDVWLRSLKRDKVSWLSLWDGKGSTGGAVLKYNASKLPTYVLMDMDGKIIDKWYGYSTGSLRERLKKFNMTEL
jgi:thiol-disulfide isomerase/thioredoxin